MTKKQMNKRMRKILKHVESGGDPDIRTPADSDLWGECVVRGFLNVTQDSGQDESGIWHISLLNHNITPAGVEWLYSPNTALKSNISLVVSIAALLVSVLSNFEEIVSSVKAIAEIIGFLQ